MIYGSTQDGTISSAMVFSVLKKLLFLNGIFFLLMSVFRLVFFTYFADFRDFAGLYEYLLRSFAMGMRFDLSVVAYVNILVTLSFLVVRFINRERHLHTWLTAARYYYTVMYYAVFAILSVDIGFYSYFKNHINILIFGVFEDDTAALLSTLKENYNILLVVAGFAALFFVIHFICRRFTSISIGTGTVPGTAKNFRLPYRIGFAFFLLCANALAARGSLGMFPLGTIHAEISPDTFINKLTLNAIYTLQEAVDFRLREDKGFSIAALAGYDSPEKALADLIGARPDALTQPLVTYLTKRTPKNDALERARPNVVLIMMEGFGTGMLRYNTDRFNVLGELKKHFDADYVFYNFISGDVGTIGSIETVALNIPKRPMAKAVTQSKYAFVDHVSGAAFPYKKAGYETAFLYGGNAAWRDLLSFMPHAGFNVVEGEGAMDKGYLRNQWGVYDEHLFDHMYKKLLSNEGKPKFIFAMSTTNHPPYSLPPSYTQLPLIVEGDLDKDITGDRKLAQGRFMTYQYANQKLGAFISRIKASPLGKNTIIAVTGDHNFWSVFDYPNEEYLDIGGVPFYVYVPDALKPKHVDTEAFGSHVDIMPTLYDLSLSDREYVSIGNSLVDEKIPHVAYNVDGIIMAKDSAVRYNAENGTTAYFTWDPKKKRRLADVAGGTEKHRQMITHYKAALAVTEFLLNHALKG